jgi:glycosyltransferase involved in cell wall biosynthesis
VQVSVIIPVKDDERIFACVESILANSAGSGGLQVLVVDNGSAAALRQRLSDLPAPVEVLDEARAGAYAARNRAIAAARGEAVFFTDADCAVREGWIEAGLRCLATGADIVQGFSGSLGHGRSDRLIQRRYEAHFLSLRGGQPTECDTRNLAVRHAVLERLSFNDRFRRVGDTEFGLLAESFGFRVAYCPAMRVDHAHEREVALFLAKQLCHGWGAQRLMQDHPEVRWHSGHLRTVARVSRWSRRLPGQGMIARALGRTTLAAGGLIDQLADRVPETPAAWALTALDKSAALAGHLMYEAGADEPAPSSLLGRDHPRD